MMADEDDLSSKIVGWAHEGEEDGDRVDHHRAGLDAVGGLDAVRNGRTGWVESSSRMMSLIVFDAKSSSNMDAEDSRAAWGALCAELPKWRIGRQVDRVENGVREVVEHVRGELVAG